MKFIEPMNSYFFLLFSVFSEGRQTRSYGCRYAVDGQFPYAALLSYGGSKNNGASIIHERWALTAAHCKHDDRGNPLLTVGTIKHLGFGVNYGVERFHVHPNFTIIPEEENGRPDYAVNDIGLIRLSSNITFNDKVQPVALAIDEKNSYENCTGTLAGWGSTGYVRTFLRDMHEKLCYINVRILSHNKCKSVWILADKHICTSNQEHQGICYGDSGSPLVVDGVQIGIASASDTYCESLKPDLYTKVASYLPWIKSIMSQYGDVLPDL